MTLEQLAAEYQRVMELDKTRLPYAWNYVKMGQRVYGKSDSANTMIADVRGWGHLTGGALNLPHGQAMVIQDATGEFIAAAPLIAEMLRTLMQELVAARDTLKIFEHHKFGDGDYTHAVKKALARLTPIATLEAK